MTTPPDNGVAAIVLDSLDRAWNPLLARLAGLTDAEYHWEPAPDGWTVHPDAHGVWRADWHDDEPEPAPVTTIAWRCWHIARDCLDDYSARAFDGHSNAAGEPETAWPRAWPEARDCMTRAFTRFRAGVAAWNDDDLLTPLGPRFPMNATRTHLDLILHAEREVVHHGAEIALLRDLYRTR